MALAACGPKESSAGGAQKAEQALPKAAKVGAGYFACVPLEAVRPKLQQMLDGELDIFGPERCDEGKLSSCFTLAGLRRWLWRIEDSVCFFSAEVREAGQGAWLDELEAAYGNRMAAPKTLGALAAAMRQSVERPLASQTSLLMVTPTKFDVMNHPPLGVQSQDKGWDWLAQEVTEEVLTSMMDKAGDPINCPNGKTGSPSIFLFGKAELVAANPELFKQVRLAAQLFKPGILVRHEKMHERLWNVAKKAVSAVQMPLAVTAAVLAALGGFIGELINTAGRALTLAETLKLAPERIAKASQGYLTELQAKQLVDQLAAAAGRGA